MRKLYINLFCFILFFLSVFNADAQYVTGIGLRGGVSSGLSVIQYLSQRSLGTINFNLGMRQKGILGTVLFEMHSPNHNLRVEIANGGIFGGVGFHIGSVKSENYGNIKNHKRVMPIGLDAEAGIEWKLPYKPLLLSADVRLYYEYVKEYKELTGYRQLDFLDYGITLRYVFR